MHATCDEFYKTFRKHLRLYNLTSCPGALHPAAWLLHMLKTQCTMCRGQMNMLPVPRVKFPRFTQVCVEGVVAFVAGRSSYALRKSMDELPDDIEALKQLVLEALAKAERAKEEAERAEYSSIFPEVTSSIPIAEGSCFGYGF